jgi:hypothetical protein
MINCGSHSFFFLSTALLLLRSNLLEKTSDAVIKAAKNGDLAMVM